MSSFKLLNCKSIRGRIQRPLVSGPPDSVLVFHPKRMWQARAGYMLWFLQAWCPCRGTLDVNIPMLL